MVTGHLAIAFLARARWPRSTLLPLLVASIVPDLADFALPQGDQCRTACGMYTHAVPAVFVLATFAAFLSWEIFHRRATTYLVAGLVVVHVMTDLLTGFKPYWPGGPPIGLRLYDHPLLDFVIEGALATVAWAVLRRTTHAPRAATHAGALGLLLLLQGAFDYWQAGLH